MSLYYLSFADEAGFKGALVVNGDDISSALLEAHLNKLSPGGEVLGMPVPENLINKIKSSDTYRLLNKKEASALAGSE